MPADVTDKYIRIRKKDPKKYLRLRTKTLSSSKGVKAIIGFKKEGGSEVQAYLFDKTKWTVAKAKQWVGEHKTSEKLLEGKMKNVKIFLSLDINKLDFSDGKFRKTIQVLQVGSWKHPLYGLIKITKNDISEFVNNFKEGIRRDIPITEGHSVGGHELPAVGWFTQLVNKGQKGLWAAVEWTDKGIQLLKDVSYKYFSPEFYSTYEDPETHKIYSNVLVGGALTNQPYFKGLQAIALSEFTFDEDEMPSLEEILKKEVADLTEDEKKEINDHEEDLTEEQKETYKTVLEGEGEGGDDDKGDEEDDEGEGDEGDDDDEGDEGDDDEGDEGAKGSEKMVKIGSRTLKILSNKAQEGVKAMALLRKQTAESVVKVLTFGENNPRGPLLPKSRDKVVKFYLSLTEVQQKYFKEILDSLPKSKLFSELGEEDGVEVKAEEQVQGLVNAKMDKDSALTYREALDQVLAENPELADRLA